ncbi:MAG: CbiX/SirB N-terminal domain-containing protein [Bryobacterales bacterium]|nr:CbiX/SirB N-terminal domain-containing protein [Bryobacterales bacterium]
MKTAIIVFAHGSSVETANEAVRAVTREAARAGGFALMETAFLEMAQPDLPAAVEKMHAAGAERIIVVPYFLTLGIHLRRDLPRIVEELTGRYDGLSIEVTDPLDGHPALARIVQERAQKALEC